MNLVDILNNGGSIEISKNAHNSVREENVSGLPFRVTIELPCGVKSLRTGNSSIDFIFRNDADLIAGLIRMNCLIAENIILPPAGAP